MTEEFNTKWFKRRPRIVLGYAIGAASGIAVGALTDNFWIGFFAGVAFGLLTAFGDTGTAEPPTF